ncbi:bZIP 1 domain containing protein [Asbolus verrucosus]|uniref:BZIP 1 domain containing protein n=1 Tax=Asbolus verrucosus TaxID=1661398 RepID=A0A482V7P7_ASBVE|nr:bZIP 1 domain containing protein [Asbolus verrucosus]
MVSNSKRMKYVSENEFSSSAEDDVETSFDDDYSQQNRKKSNVKPKWLSKNAIMARENRLKKKLYVTNLENEVGRLKTENENFTKVIENQSLLIADLKKEIKYLKSVIANSSDIGNLIKSIHRNTGMSVTTSLDQTLSLNNDYVSKQRHHIARKTAHPWEEKQYPSFPTPESDFLSSPHSDNGLNDLNSDDLFSNLALAEIMEPSDNFVDGLVLGDETTYLNEGTHLQEHDYTNVEDDGDVGVCLHVSKHRVSLEFCSTCSENACQTWMD